MRTSRTKVRTHENLFEAPLQNLALRNGLLKRVTARTPAQAIPEASLINPRVAKTRAPEIIVESEAVKTREATYLKSIHSKLSEKFANEKPQDPALSAKAQALAQECIDADVVQSYARIKAGKRNEFIEAVKRSIIAVRDTALPEHMSLLAFKLAFNLDSSSLAKFDAVADDSDWKAYVVAKLGDQAEVKMVNASAFAQVMLKDPSKAQSVFDGSRYQAKRLLKKVLPSRPKAADVARHADMALALRNFSVRQIEQFGPLDSKLEAKLVNKAKALLKAGGQANAVAWTIELVHLANQYRAKHYAPH